MNTQKKVVLIQGGTLELARSVAATLLERGARVAFHEPKNPAQSASLAAELAQAGDNNVLDLTALSPAHDDPRSALLKVVEHFEGLDAVVNLYVPTVADTADSLGAYQRVLETSVNAAASFMEERGNPGIIINQYMQTTMFVDHPLVTAAAAARGGVSALTRTACIRFGKSGVRILGLLVGLLDLAEIKAMASERVLAATTPLGRWITTADVAATVGFLALDSGYITGQMIVLDGGMTSGVNGA